jgi:hypothetical protein
VNLDLTAHPTPGIEFFERVVNSTLISDTSICACTAYEAGNRCGVTVFQGDLQTTDTKRINIESDCPAAGQPVIAATGSGVVLVWIEYSQTRVWRLMAATIEHGQTGGRRCLWERRSLILYPAICLHKGQLHVAFTALSDENNRFEIMYAVVPENGSKIEPVVLSSSAADANRADMASNGGQIMVAWDSMAGEISVIDYVIINRHGVTDQRKTIGRAGERWLSPFLAADTSASGKCFYMSWLISSDVEDRSRGIVDHQVSAGCIRITEQTEKYLPANSRKDGIIAADLRPGLLGVDKYCGYYGLRRRPRPIISNDGDIYLVWEAMYEPVVLKAAQIDKISTGPSCGQLMAIKLTDESWGQPTLIHSTGTNYTVPSQISGDKIPVFYLDLQRRQTGPAFCCDLVNFHQGIPVNLTDDLWSRWQPYRKPAARGPKYETKLGDETYKLYWADTHTHSVFSPDAEGEPDEMINSGRSVADLDIMAIVDNDFYPFFGLTKLKWQIHLALAAKYTNEGFIYFPGFEYTYHDSRLQPDFNHRYVLYPRSNGSLHRRTDADAATIDDLMDLLEPTEAIPFVHHTTWQLSGSQIDHQVEVCSSWRVCKEESDFIDRRLMAGDRFSFIGSSDTHRNVPGLGGALTGIYARELTPEAVFDAYRNHRVIATQGNRTAIDLCAGGCFIGQTGVVSGGVPIRLTVRADACIEFVSIVRDGCEIRRFTGQDNALKADFVDQIVTPGDHFYYATVKLAGDPSFNAPDGLEDGTRVFFSEKASRYPHNFARAVGPYAWCTPVWLKVVAG